MTKKKNYKEIIDILKEKYNHKSNLIDWIEIRLHLKIPKTYSYEKIISTLVKQSKEEEFSAKAYNYKSFSEIIEKSNIDDALLIFSKKELELFAKSLSQNQKLWKYNKDSLDKLRKTIVRNSNLKQFQNLFPKLIQEKKIYPVMQYYKSVIGPLGITRSKIKRKSMESDELVSFLSNYLTKETFPDVLKQTNFKKLINNNFDENLKPFALQQYLLTHVSLEGIAKIFNALIENEVIKISEIERFWGYTVTPCGVILDKETDPNENLVHILLEKIPKKVLKKELENEGFQSGSLELRLYGKCVMGKPEEILANEFGKTDLRQIGQKLGLVRVSKISDIDELIKYVMLQLGFILPEKVTGVLEYIDNLENLKIELQNRPKSEQIGIMNRVYIITEKILKDLIYFYSALIWEDILNIGDRNEMIEHTNSHLKSELSIENDVSRLMFGQLLGLMKKMNNHVTNNQKFKKIHNTKLGRSQLFPKEEISILGVINDNRAKFTHDVDSSIISKNLLTPKQIIEDLLKFGKKLRDKKIYPIAFRILREVTNEYNISYHEILDEQGNQIKVFSNEFLDVGKSGFMINKTDNVAVKPIIVTKFW